MDEVRGSIPLGSTLRGLVLQNASQRPCRTTRALEAVLAITVFDCAYLSWRYVALRAGWVTPHTGLCSWTQAVDCDVVLQTPEARAFFVPNALLGLGFFVGCLAFFAVGRRRYPAAKGLLVRLLAVALFLGTLFTFRFFQLLVRLPALCPFCPWNHVWTWTSLALVALLVRKTPLEGGAHAARELVPLTLILVAQFFGWFALWGILVATHVMTP